MKARWDLVLLPSLLVMLLLLGASQYVFLKGSFFRDLGLGRTGDVLEATNYLRFFTDPFYLRVLWITTKVSLLATVFTLLLGYPLAYVIARMRSRWAMVLLAGVVVTTFVVRHRTDVLRLRGFQHRKRVPAVAHRRPSP